MPRKKRNGPIKRAWRSIRGPLARSDLAQAVLARAIYGGLKFTFATNPFVAGSPDRREMANRLGPGIVALWHGQHLMMPCIKLPEMELTAMISRSADAELNARVLALVGVNTARGSGGRGDGHNLSKGGARALVELKRALDAGQWATMIADIPHGTPREAGIGVVTLAKISGKPVIPVAYATSRRKVLEKTWDKTTIPLPFGRAALTVGDPIDVPSNADEAMMEQKRREITIALNAATETAYGLVDGVK